MSGHLVIVSSVDDDLESLADDMLAVAARVDRAGAEAISERETWAAMQHLVESIEAAERAVTRLRDGP